MERNASPRVILSTLMLVLVTAARSEPWNHPCRPNPAPSTYFYPELSISPDDVTLAAQFRIAHHALTRTISATNSWRAIIEAQLQSPRLISLLRNYSQLEGFPDVTHWPHGTDVAAVLRKVYGRLQRAAVFLHGATRPLSPEIHLARSQLLHALCALRVAFVALETTRPPQVAADIVPDFYTRNHQFALIVARDVTKMARTARRQVGFLLRLVEM